MSINFLKQSDSHFLPGTLQADKSAAQIMVSNDHAGQWSHQQLWSK